jgi:hypothetical protein
MNSVSGNELEGRRIATTLVPIESICGDDELDTKLLIEMAEYSTKYISSFSWCEAILESYFAGGVGGIFAVFFFNIKPSRPEVDPWIWIMGGVVPPAYLPLRDCSSSSEAFSLYIEGMSKWVEYARKGQAGDADQGVPPVNVPATPEWAEELGRRLKGLALAVKPFFEENSEEVHNRK